MGSYILNNSQSASLNHVHVILGPGVVAVSAQRPPEVAPESPGAGDHGCHDGPEGRAERQQLLVEM